VNSPLRILVTGGRSPVALEWCRRLARSNCFVVAADTSFLTLTRFCRHVSLHERYASPRNNPDRFNRDIQRICHEHGIDLVVPTCEELFWLTDATMAAAAFFHPGRDLSRRLHDKLYLNTLSSELNIPAPQTWLRSELPSESGSWIVKPRFTRSGFNVRKIEGKINASMLGEMEVAQPAIIGEQLCYTGMALHGKVLVDICYTPAVRIRRNKGSIDGPAIAFKTADNTDLANHARKIIENLGYTGMLGIDAITTRNGVSYIHDINPRTTSGIHLLAPEVDFTALLRGEQQELMLQESSTAWIPSAVWFSHAPLRNVYRSWRQPRWIDVISSRDDRMPAIGQLAVLLQLMRLGRRYNRSPMTAATVDIEWNGEPDG